MWPFCRILDQRRVIFFNFFPRLSQKTDLIGVHLVGAGMTFAPGALYILVQTGVSYRMQPRFHGTGILWTRTAVGLWALVSIVTCILLLRNGL